MELRHLRYFVAVADAASFTAAARGLNISQPPLSQQIRDLEAEVGTRLFERSSRNVELTEAGANFLEHARMILGQVEHATHQARAIGSGQVGTLNIATTGSVLLGPLSNLIARFRDAWPGVFVRIHEMDPEAQEAALLSHRTDLSFVRKPRNHPHLVALVAWQEKVDVALPEHHRLANSGTIELGDLRQESFVFLRLADSRFARYLHDCCVTAGFVPDITNEVVESYSLTSLVAAGLGVALVPNCISTLSRPGVVYRPLADPAPEADVHVISRPNPGPVVSAFLETAQSTAVNPR
ncbi:LysR family transcriptional regulator [Sinorhizobium medicae]|uniref:Transcriptional regulator, LysR family n=1 Tax=Sinorhizobium medicae (strain WSM419) TaxID=366394 RepID=A6UHI0_SINMW|nr:LysR family transcriptional regulator [Sinorhizobium medicae]ABR63110.1 transcriptional regulator, LysR family [Sinorhizobium medicae WSM419]MBO1961820.1 LysR family transcriptional regulator [Sinorhizobium medicae]MDX0436044.1 LysR family transcriptional regulator [Sinorhizobium medicae]MDX0617004.1 LysR family transcriptional regulator [Sinorhizobium medicae]MDX0651010.1 LysR family transcriptional regulator [Sinorhizobium medicae]